MNEQPPPETIVKPQSHWKRVFAGMGIALMAILAYLWYGIPPTVPSQPVRLTRAADGTLQPEVAPDQSGAGFEVQAGAIRANNNFSSGSSSSRSGREVGYRFGIYAARCEALCVGFA
jgi:hypothetical protein